MCNNPWFDDNRYNPLTGKKVPLPCGKCQGCRIDYMLRWSRRLSYEYVSAPSAFVTFTYDDNHLRYNKGSLYPTVRLDDFSKYIESIRNKLRYMHIVKRVPVPVNNNINFKYFCTSEYSPELNRPHYHCLFFGLDFQAYRNFFKSTWKMGSIVDVRPILRGGIRYCLKYIEKKQFSDDCEREYFDKGRDKPFMSCSPSIGSSFFISQIPNINKYGMLKIGNRFVTLEPYWKNKLFNFCDKNVYRVQAFRDNRVQDMDAYARSIGYSCYDNYMIDLRKQYELAFESSATKNHEPIRRISSQFSTVKHLPQDFLLLNTSSVWLDHLDSKFI